MTLTFSFEYRLTMELNNQIVLSKHKQAKKVSQVECGRLLLPSPKLVNAKNQQAPKARSTHYQPKAPLWQILLRRLLFYDDIFLLQPHVYGRKLHRPLQV